MSDNRAAQIITAALGVTASDAAQRIIDNVEDAGLEIVDLSRLVAAIQDAGPKPGYHAEVMRRHRQEWPTLWAAIDDLLWGNDDV